MIEPIALRDLPAARPDRVAGSGLGLAVAERQGAAASPGEARPLSPAVSQASPFDRQDLVEIRGNVRPLAADARLAAGPADEEGGGSPEGGAREEGERAGSLQRRVLAAYSLPGILPQQVLQAAPGGRASPPPPAPSADRKSRQMAEAFSAREPEAALGRLLDLAA